MKVRVFLINMDFFEETLVLFVFVGGTFNHTRSQYRREEVTDNKYGYMSYRGGNERWIQYESYDRLLLRFEIDQWLILAK